VTILPINPAENATPDALRAFLTQCRDAAARAGRPKLVSISLAVDALDPLAVLESIFEPAEPHFYTERPDIESAVAGAEIAVAHEATGRDRFASAQRFIDDTLENTIAVGDVAAPFGGPHFFASFSFQDATEPGEPFPAASVFVPRWQVARAGPTTTAVANFLITADSDLAALSERVWRAHGKFRKFEFGAGDVGGAPSPRASSSMRGEGTPPTFQICEAGDYRAAVARGLDRINAGEFRKIVLARAIELSASEPLHPLRVLNGLRQRFPDCYSFSRANGWGQGRARDRGARGFDAARRDGQRGCRARQRAAQQ
jgi:menaquinone-specific isochorismate synthase